MSDFDTLKALSTDLESQALALRRLDDYYEGRQPLRFLPAELAREIDRRLWSVAVNWPRLVVDSVEERLDVEGFRLPGSDDADTEMWRVWQANNLDELSQQAHTDALALGRSYITVGTGADVLTPLISVESPLEMAVDIDPRTRQVRAAVKRWDDAGDSFATLYTPQYTRWMVARKGSDEWSDYEPPDDHRLGVVPVVPLVNRPRIRQPMGVSEMSDVLPLADAANSTLIDMMVVQKYYAAPRRYVLGIDGIEDEHGEPVSDLRASAKHVWYFPEGVTNVGQFAEAELTNFHNTLNQLARLVASLTGLPPHYLGFTTDNPASADAIRSNEARLVKRAERKQRGFGGSWEQAMRLADRIATRAWRPELRNLEVLWRDAATPTLAQKSDAAVKLVSAGIVPPEYGQELIGLSATARQRIADMQSDPTLERVLRSVQAVPGGTA